MLFFDDRSQLPSSLIESLRDFDVLRRPGGLRIPSAGFTVREVRLDARVGRNDLFVSSSLSDGLRIVFLAGDPLRTVFGIAEGSNLGRILSLAGSAVTLVMLPNGSLVRVEISRLLLLFIGSGLRVSSELLPAPRKITGLNLFRKKSSISPLVVLVILLLRVEGVCVKLSDVVPALADRPMLAPIELLLLPLDACLPYPSWPVPAAGPFRTSLLSDLLACGAGSVFVRREKKQNLLLELETRAGAGSVLERRVLRSF